VAFCNSSSGRDRPPAGRSASYRPAVPVPARGDRDSLGRDAGRARQDRDMLRLSLDGPDCISTRFWPRTTSSGRLATRRVAGGVDHQPVVVDRHAHRRHPLEPRRCGARGAAPAGAIRVVVLPVFAL